VSLNKSKSLRTAEKYVLQGKIPAAIDEYRKVVDADPTDLTTINTLGDLFVRAGRIQDAIINFSRIADQYRETGFTLKAIAMLKKISKLDPTNVETAMKLANLYSQQGLLVEARQQYLQVADAYARAGQTRKALEAYQKIADLDPANTSVRMKLGDIYAREGMVDQAHEALTMAGAEFLRKGDTEQALNANLKAIAINPESRQALTAIAAIYTQRGQADRAINLLCDAFEANPGDVELLTILGRTYLSAGQMDDAERTFLSLVELDRNRYNYLLEVGRTFLQMGSLDRAAEQIDGCLDVLIAKREEDKAIDFLRRVLDKDLNHIGSLKRLAQIFLRIREDHNLIATLNSLAEAAMKQGDEQEAISALKELARLDPDEPMHLQRLYNLGVRDIVEPDSPDVVRATGPLDYESAAFDETFVIRQISEAEILAGHGQVDHAVTLLRAILNHAPENVQVHLKLKDIYLRVGKMDKAADECLELARIHEGRGESARASDFVAEAHQLNPLLGPAPLAQNQDAAGWPGDDERAFGFDSDIGISQHVEEPAARDTGGGFEVREATSGLDLTQYQTGPLSDLAGFVTLPGGTPSKPYSEDDKRSDFRPADDLSDPFRYSDTLIGDVDEEPSNPVVDVMFSSAGDLASDTMSGVLRDELEGIDFYIAQGYFEIARDTLERLRTEHGNHPEIVARYRRLGASGDLPPVPTTGELIDNTEIDSEPEQPVIGSSFGLDSSSLAPNRNGANGQPVIMTMEEEDSILYDSPSTDQMTVDVASTPAEGERRNVLPLMVNKESGPLDRDLLVQFNTSELINSPEFEALISTSVSRPAPEPVEPELEDLLAPPRSRPAPDPAEAQFVPLSPPRSRPPTKPLEPPVEKEAKPPSLPLPHRVGTSELMESFLSGIESSFADLARPVEVEPPSPPAFIEPTVEEVSPVDDFDPYEAEPAAFSAPQVSASGDLTDLTDLADEGVETELQQMLEDLKGNTGDLPQAIDYETHFNLGLAYKDMDLLEEAIEQFQMASKLATITAIDGNYIQCCHMLGVCFKLKGMPKVAVMWFERGLKVQNRAEDEYQALRYEIGLCYEGMGNIGEAIDAFMEVFGIDVNYRSVGEKIKELQAAKNA
jgi:tetratricopeptide (TPR) repeat protein